MSEETKATSPNTLTIELNLSDIFVDRGDEERSLTDLVKEHINYTGMREIKAAVDSAVSKHLQETIVKNLDGILSAMFSAKVEQILTAEKLSFGGYKDTTMQEFIIDRITRMEGRSIEDTLKRHCEKAANDLGTKLKAQYDIAFANVLVQKLDNVGLLKSDVVRLLLSQET